MGVFQLKVVSLKENGEAINTIQKFFESLMLNIIQLEICCKLLLDLSTN